jgi:hypothetical protein
MKLVDVYQGTGILPGAIDFLYEVMAERAADPEMNISFTMPTPEQHRQFVHRRPYRCWYLIEVEGALVGYVNATTHNEIGIFLLKKHRGKGYGEQAVRALMEKHEPLPAIPSERRGKWIANVAPSNEHSKHLFGGKLSGRLIQLTYELPGGEDGEEETEGRARPVR